MGRELKEALTEAVRQARFRSWDLGVVDSEFVKSCYERSEWHEDPWLGSLRLDPARDLRELLRLEQLELDQCVLQEVERCAERLVARYRHPKTGRVGNGLFLLRGGPVNLAQPTLLEFAKLLVIGATRIGPGRVAELVHGWVDDEPLRTRECALIEGVGVEKEVALLEQRIRLSRMPLSKNDLPASFPEGSDLSLHRLRRGVILSVDRETRPALYNPDDLPNKDAFWDLMTYVPASRALGDFSLDGFCQHLALATNSYVGWNLRWEDVGDLDAFCLMGGQSFGFGTDFDARGPCIAEQQLEHSVGTMRRAGELEEESLRKFGIALSRWVQSKRPATLDDRLIDLRVSLEVLFVVERHGKQRQTACRGALHLGGAPEEIAARRALIYQVYGEASEVVHAGAIEDELGAEVRLKQVQDICRSSMLKVLEDGSFPV